MIREREVGDVVLTCTNPNCSVEVHGTTRGDVKARARAAGWTVGRADGDRCPAHRQPLPGSKGWT